MSTKLLTATEVINRAKEVHGDKYDYSLTEYKNSRTKVKIICKVHGEFYQKIEAHLNGHGCRKCAYSKRSQQKRDRTFPPEKIKLLKENYPKHSIKKLTSILDVGRDAISNKIKELGLLDPTERLKNPTVGEIPSRYMINLLAGAKKRNLEYKISTQYIWEIFLAQKRKCALTGWDIGFNKGNVTASLDRIDSSKGYIEGNVQWVHKSLNKLKINLAEQDFYKMCEAVSKFRKNDFDPLVTIWEVDRWYDTEFPRTIRLSELK